MSERPWELVVATLGDGAWDEATELASMIADDHYPNVMREDISRSFAASTVVALVTDPDYRRCIEGLLRTVPAPVVEMTDG